MPKKADPLSEWKKRVQPTEQAAKGFAAIQQVLKQYEGDALESQSQEFPPRYLLDISPRVPLHHGKRFASLGAVTDSIYFNLAEWDDDFQKEIRRVLKGAPFLPSDGYELKRVSDDLLAQITALIQSAYDKLKVDITADETLEPYQPKVQHPVPPASVWTAPISWVGPKADASKDFSAVPGDAVFTRCEIQFTLYEVKGPGMKNLTQRSLPGLLELEPASKKARRGQSQPLVVAAHTVGFDGQPWSFRLVLKRRQKFMMLFVGDFADQKPASGELLKRYRFERVVVQALLATERGKAIQLALRENFEIDETTDEEEED